MGSSEGTGASYWARRRATALAVALVLLAAACGDDSGNDAQASGGPAVPTSEPPSGEPIRIGALVDASGRVARQDGPSESMLEAWAEWVNDEGGIAGHPVEIVFRDTRADPAAATAAAQELVRDESVSAVVSVASVTDAVFGPILSEASLPVIGGAGVSSRVWGALPNVFGVLATQPTYSGTLAYVSHDVNDTESIGVITCIENPACAQGATLYEAIAENTEVRYDGTLTVAFDAPNYTAECLRLAEEETEAVALAVGAETAVRIIRDCTAQGFEPDFVMVDGTVTQEFLEPVAAGIEVVGAINGFPWFGDADYVAPFLEIMERYGVDENDYANGSSTATWASLELFRKALDDYGVTADDAVDRETVLAAYSEIDDETLGGMIPQPVSFTAGEPMPVINCYWSFRYVDGEFTLVGDGEPDCFDPDLAGS